MDMYRLKTALRWAILLAVSFGVAYSVDRYYFFREGSCYANNTITGVNQVLRSVSGH